LAEPYVIPFGQVVDVLIPHLIRKNHVQPLVRTWDKIYINVVEARGLMSKDINGKSDPYVKLSCDTWKERTKIMQETLNPKWNETFELNYDTQCLKILFKVMDHDRIGRDEFLGTFTVSIRGIPPNKEMNRWFRLQGTGKKDEKVTGSVYVKFQKVATNF